MPPRDDAIAFDFVPELTGKEAILLVRLLTRLADEISRTYSVDIHITLAEEQGIDLQIDTDPLPTSDEDLPF